MNSKQEIHDCVHGRIELPEYAVEIIKTKQFKRLKRVQQLGATSYIFKNATHSRYEHCIGTGFLCMKMMETLERNSQVHSRIVDYELKKKCVIIAGLCHDMGHGPFSHMWEHVIEEGTDKDWTHELQSQRMIESMLTDNNIKLHNDEIKHKIAFRLISSLIKADEDEWNNLLNKNEMFLTEIVSNKYCNIDVDKFDYILRDAHYMEQYGIKIRPFVSFMNSANVCYDSEGISHIAYHVDDFPLIENLFYNRAYLHDKVYQLDKVAACEQMIKDVCILASAGGVKIGRLPLSDVQRDPSAYLKLDDTVLDVILYLKSDSEQIKNAKEILKNLENSNFYKKIEESDKEYTAFDKSKFCSVKKKIPKANVPDNIPLYNHDGQLVEKTSNLNLEMELYMLFNKDFTNNNF